MSILTWIADLFVETKAAAPVAPARPAAPASPAQPSSIIMSLEQFLALHGLNLLPKGGIAMGPIIQTLLANLMSFIVANPAADKAVADTILGLAEKLAANNPILLQALTVAQSAIDAHFTAAKPAA